MGEDASSLGSRRKDDGGIAPSSPSSPPSPGAGDGLVNIEGDTADGASRSTIENDKSDLCANYDRDASEDEEKDILAASSSHGLDREALIRTVTRKAVIEAMNETNYDMRKLPKDTYSLFVTSDVLSVPTLVATFVVAIQYSLFGLLLSDLSDPFVKPDNVETQVRFAQAVLLLVAVVTQGDLAIAITEIVKGYDKEMESLFGAASPSKWAFAMAMKLAEGIVGLVSTFILLITLDDVYDLLLTFAGVEFVYHMDDIVFLLCKSEFYGELNYVAVQEIDEKFWVSSERKATYLPYLKPFGMMLTGIAVFSGFAAVASGQRSGNNLCQHLKVDMSDEQIASLGPLNGFYAFMPSKRNNDRVTYEQQSSFSSEEARGKFGFCKSGDYQGWALSTVSNEASGNLCEDWLIRSSDTNTFNIEDTRAIPWQLQSGRQLEFIRLSCLDRDSSVAQENGYIMPGMKEVEEGFERICRYLVLDSSTVGFRDIPSPEFGFLESENSSSSVKVFGRHVYISDDREYVMAFLGVRWVVGPTKQLLSLGVSDAVSGVLENGMDWLSSGEWIKYISEPVDSNVDTGTPLGLNWYHSMSPSSGGFPGPDLNERVNAILRCGICNSESNPCFNEGLCTEEGTCSCSHGATGSFCEIPPLGDGVCQDYFNTDTFEYDGGDCCASTCIGVACGDSAMNTLFGYNLDFPIKGYLDCRDPRMIPLTIALNMTTMPVYGDVSFYSTWEVYCDGIEYLYSPKLGYEEFLSTEVYGKQTIFVEPRVSCEVIAKTKFYFELAKVDVYRDGFEDTPIIVQEYEFHSEDMKFDFPVLSRCLLVELSTISDPKLLLDSTSTQGQAAAWIDVEAPGLSLCSTEFLSQLYALAVINFSLVGTPKENVMWLSGTNGCKWSGIFCNSAGSVSVIFLINQNLKGRIPSEIGLLADLEVINFFLNEINGTIPTELGLLTHLSDLTLAKNGLEGSLPTELGNLTNLTTLNIDNNYLAGTIPTQYGNLIQLTAFAINDNDLTGTIPTQIGNIPGLESFYFCNNGLTGFVPREVSSLTGIEISCGPLKGTNLTCYEDDLTCMDLSSEEDS